MTVDDAKHVLLDELFESIDRKDAEQFLRFLTADAMFRFGSTPSVEGRELIRDAANGFF